MLGAGDTCADASDTGRQTHTVGGYYAKLMAPPSGAPAKRRLVVPEVDDKGKVVIPPPQGMEPDNILGWRNKVSSHEYRIQAQHAHCWPK